MIRTKDLDSTNHFYEKAQEIFDNINEYGEKIFFFPILKSQDLYSRKFFISSYEMETYYKNKSKYKLYRVYYVENNPSIEEIN